MLNFNFDKKDIPESNIMDIVHKRGEVKVPEKYFLRDEEIKLINLWNDFFKITINNLPGFPIWTEYLNDKIIDEGFDELPKWKKNFINKNNALYNKNKKAIDVWLLKAKKHPQFYGAKAKFEWQAGKNPKGDIWDTIMQFRPSGLRVKVPNYFPALVAITQTSIIGSLGRRITPREAARLQSFPEDFKIHNEDRLAYKQFGNAVNARLALLFGAHLMENQDVVKSILKIEK